MSCRSSAFEYAFQWERRCNQFAIDSREGEIVKATLRLGSQGTAEINRGTIPESRPTRHARKNQGKLKTNIPSRRQKQTWLRKEKKEKYRKKSQCEQKVKHFFLSFFSFLYQEKVVPTT